MIDCLLRCIRFILGPVILSVGKECQIAERMYIFACETRDCGARRLRSNMFYRYIIIVDNGSLLWCWCSNRTISVPFDMLVQGAEQITQRFIATVCSILEVRKPDLKYSISTFGFNILFECRAQTCQSVVLRISSDFYRLLHIQLTQFLMAQVAHAFMSEHELFKHMNQVCKSFLLELHRGQQERVHNIEIQEANQYIKPLTIPIRQRLSDLIRPDACYQFAVCADFSQDLVYSIYNFCSSRFI